MAQKLPPRTERFHRNKGTSIKDVPTAQRRTARLMHWPGSLYSLPPRSSERSRQRTLQASLRGRHGRDFLTLPVLVLESHKYPTGQAGGKNDQQPAQVLHRVETTHEPKENVLDAFPPPNISKNPNGLLWQSQNRTNTQVQASIQKSYAHGTDRLQAVSCLRPTALPIATEHLPNLIPHKTGAARSFQPKDVPHHFGHRSRTSTTPNAPALLARILPESGSTRQETIDCPKWKNPKQNQEPVSIECEKSPRPGLQFQLSTNHKSTTVVSPNGFFLEQKGQIVLAHPYLCLSLFLYSSSRKVV
ncbi:unnamed protein product [Adineta ricciae]|uniref:Uncharacterized protein n=1 Tax=Adineta ricciae TaxID=249248 RepID=A0A815YA60_ADIRI|nr:unnamed protein product [Adineta ricciae]CAF1568880.1 unnamed protein product [Adineta ricciae]